MMYVVYGCEHLRDGEEEFARIVSSIDEAMEIINKDRFARDNHTFKLFELGKEIPLEAKVKKTVKKETTEKTIYSVKK